MHYGVVIFIINVLLYIYTLVTDLMIYKFDIGKG